MLLCCIVSIVLLMASLVELAVAGCERFCRASTRSALVAVDLSVMLNVSAGEEVPVVSGGSIDEGELLNKELNRKTGDRA